MQKKTIIKLADTTTDQLSVHYGKLTSCTEQQITRHYQFAITHVVAKTLGGFCMFSVALPVGITLYNYLNTKTRRNRLDQIEFEFQVLSEQQKIVAYKAYDAGEWIGNTAEH